ncbi:MAG: polymer-forming cytoskeletal protein [Culturomica sp.]|jgi:cytoskeletal protein CcmA (bactofilin family)|nr:polymer-forming cytoskeletal protein [Culturomica sp.]
MDQDSFTLPGKGSFLGEEVVVNGTLRSDDDLYLKGRVIGDVHCQASLYMNKDAVVSGNVFCGSLFSDGLITGNVRVAQRSHLKEHAVILGSLHTCSLLIHPGAKVERGLKLQGK